MDPVSDAMTRLADVLAADGPERKAKPVLAMVAVALNEAETVSDADWLKVPPKFRGTVIALFAGMMAQ